MKIKALTVLSTAFITSGLLSVHAQNLNGTVDTGFYGSPLAVQTINTGFGNAGGNDSGGGSELDAAYGAISGGSLYLFLAGSLESNGNHFNIFIDGGAAGGQNVLSPTGGNMTVMNGSIFSPGFNATFAVDMNVYSTNEGVAPGTLYTEEYNLIAHTGGYVGALAESSLGIAAGSSGGVSSLYLNNNHVSTMGTAGDALSGATSGTATTTGLELVIPLSDIGYAGGNIEVLADINGGNDGYLSNQFLTGLQVGTPNLGGGTPPYSMGGATFNFGATPGEFFTVAVPEPSTLALLGLSGLATLIRFRRKN
ncbi:MAG: PEP-CTERM sorting domain-containing protein [Limisphaerales bacterium]